MQEKLTTQKLYNVGLSYKKADVSTRGKFSISNENQILLLNEAKENGIKGLFVMSTCNRTEITGFAEHPFKLIKLLCKYSNGTVDDFIKVSNVNKGNKAINHLFRLATGLDSQILGDYEIVGQLKKSFKQAKSLGATDAYSERLVNLVLQASKKVKNKTRLSSGTTSVSYAAVQYIIKNLPDYNSKNILVFGLGKMGKHTCKNLAGYTQNKKVSLVNRTQSTVVDFAVENENVRVADYTNLVNEISNTDILIVSTGAEEPTVTKEMIKSKKDLLILDLSMPKNVAEDVKLLENIKLVNVDELSVVTDETLAIRENEVSKAELIIDIYKDEFLEWINHRRFTPAINALKESLEIIQENEIGFHKKKIQNFNEEQAKIITSHFIQKITTQFVKHLKDENTTAVQSIEVMQKVFPLNTEN